MPDNVNFCIRDGDFPIVYIAGDRGFYKYFPNAGFVLSFKKLALPQVGRMIGYAGLNVFVEPPVPPPAGVELIVPTNGSTVPGGVWHYTEALGWTLKNNGLPSGVNWTRCVASPIDPDTWVVYKQDLASSEPCRVYWTKDAGANWAQIDLTNSGQARIASLSIEIGYDNQMAGLGEFLTSGPNTVNAYAFWGGIDGEDVDFSATLTSQASVRSRFVGAAQPFPDGKLVWTAAGFYVFGRYYYTFGTATPGSIEPIFGDWSGITEENDQPEKLRGRARFVDKFGEHWYGAMLYPLDAANENEFALYQSPNHALAPGPVKRFASPFSRQMSTFCILSDGRLIVNQIGDGPSIGIAPSITALSDLNSLPLETDPKLFDLPVIALRSDRQTGTQAVAFPSNQVKGYIVFDGATSTWTEISRPAGGVSNGDIIVRGE